MKKLVFLIFCLFFISCGGGGSENVSSSEESYAQPGDFTFSLLIDGLNRTYLVHVPQNYSLSQSHPVIFALHGGGGSAEKMVELTKGGFNAISEREKVLVVYPNAVENHWNDGRNLDIYYSQRENVDDVKFISSLIDWCTEKYKIDLKRVYITGFSNGALMSFRLISDLGHRIAAAAPVCGSISETFYPLFNTENPVNTLIINGEEDPLIPWAGGDITFGDLELGSVLPIEQVFGFLATSYNCSSYSPREYLPDTVDDGTKVWKEAYTLCDKNVSIILCGIEGGGHNWPSGDSYFPESVVGAICYDIDGSEFIWDFFKDKVKTY